MSPGLVGSGGGLNQYCSTMAVAARIDEGRVVIELSGLDWILSFKRRLAIPVGSITAVEAKPPESIQRLPGRWLRLPGTYVPSMVHHGSYGLGDKREFWAMFRQERVLVMRLKGWDYSRLILGVPDPDRVAAELSSIRR